MKNMALAILVLILALGGFLIWFKTAISSVSQDQQYKNFIIPKGQSFKDTAKNLEKENLIKNAAAFRLLALLKGDAKKIQAGSFKISADMTSSQILTELTVGTFDVWITIIEGWRDEEIASVLNEKLGINPKEFLNEAREGFMFPDTYLIPKKANSADVVKILRDNFDKQATEDLRKKIQQGGLTLEQAVILASIIEREVKLPEDRPVVAGILLKRWRAGLRLEADSTVQYALGYQKDEKSWWKKNLTDTDLANDSPYNTRKFAGLPPTPICNPGLSAIKAAVAPVRTNFLYYVSDRQGKMHYAETLEEHINNINKYL